MDNNIQSVDPIFDLNSSSRIEPLSPDYDPEIIEVFDDRGWLWTLIHKQEFYQDTRPASHKPIYIAWYFDTQLVYFHMGKNVLLNRLELLAFNYLSYQTDV